MRKIFKKDIKNITTAQGLVEHINFVNYSIKCLHTVKESKYGVIELDNYWKKVMLSHIEALLSDEHENSIDILIKTPTKNGMFDCHLAYLHESFLLKNKHANIVKHEEMMEAL